MPDNSANSTHIAKNTLLLYVRMLFIMAVQLFTSRVVLNTLGVVDYGLYNVVGGIVTMFAFLNGAMVTSTQRYITFELGRGDSQRLQEVFTTSFQILMIMSFVVILLGETIGLWFMYEKMIIPPERFSAAMWVYQISILTMVVQMLSIPYNSAIVAHEQMGIFAAITVVEVVLKLAIVYLLLLSNYDKLIVYAVLILVVQLLVRYLYTRYCNKNYKESKFIKAFDKNLAKEISSFMGWNMWGSMAATLYTTGLNLLLNVFFGPIVNAARAIAVQVQGAVIQFSSNFQMAINPQITKKYAQGQFDEMHKLIYRSSKFSYFLLLIISLPVMVETETILKIWLDTVPDYTAVFVRLMICASIIDAVANSLMVSAAATGDVRKYQSIVGGILLSIVPISYVCLQIGADAASVFWVHICVNIVAFVVRLYIVRSMVSLPISGYLSAVIGRCFAVTIPAVFLSMMMKYYLGTHILDIITNCILSVLITLIFEYALGLTQNERIFLKDKMLKYIIK